jgi:hypothetical protein
MVTMEKEIKVDGWNICKGLNSYVAKTSVG